MLWWYAAALDGLDDGFPFVGAEPGGCYAGIGYVEDGDGEGLELGGWGDGEVDHLVVTLVEFHMMGYYVRTRRFVRYTTPDLHCCE